ncbi:MAG TPA: ROK family protein [Candidatus Atribacteria bacterium]|nr:ROK family protein [Candidatus Atribacteria bacterium]HPT79263.1 ROK family protein [Candidatus Atribacteria bacterium]
MYILGIDIGGTKCAVLLAAYDKGKVDFIDKITFPTRHETGVEAAIQRLISESREIMRRNGQDASSIAAAGINCGGPLDSKRGVILCPPNLIGWVNIPIVERIEKELGIRAFLQNDANAGAIAEHLFGAGRGYDNIIFLTFGTGMGAGLILDGRLYSGTSDMAGEVGHIRLDSYGPVGFGKAGSFEGFCSGGGIAQLARDKALEKLQVGETVSYCSTVEELGGLTAQRVAEAARAGDPTAREVFRICGTYLGKALSLFIDILNPQLIILGSIYGRCRDLLEEPMTEVINRETIPFSRQVCRVVASGLGEQINDYEAVAIAVYHLEGNA